MYKENISYSSQEITDYYSSQRQTWDDFYPSEQWVFKHIAQNKNDLGKVLDVGCAGGGLAKALNEQFNLEFYTGVDIHQGIIDWAKENQRYSFPSEFLAGDVTRLSIASDYDLVVSLGCADWNIQTLQIIQSCWEKVKPGGNLAVSLRLTTEDSVNDIGKSYQYINFTGDDESPEIANYVVLNYQEAVHLLEKLKPQASRIGAYGYWGKPSQTAHTPFEQILFSVFYIQKAMTDDPLVKEFHWPKDIEVECTK